MNLLLGLVWAGLGIYLIVLHSTTDSDLARLNFIPGKPSGGWLALLLAVYNLIQWWARENARRQQREAQLLELERRERMLRDREDERRPPGEVDPNFQFTDDPNDRKKS